MQWGESDVSYLFDFLGVIALEMYLLQNIFITKLTHVIDNDILFFAAVYAGTIALAYVVHKLVNG